MKLEPNYYSQEFSTIYDNLTLDECKKRCSEYDFTQINSNTVFAYFNETNDVDGVAANTCVIYNNFDPYINVYRHKGSNVYALRSNNL